MPMQHLSLENPSKDRQRLADAIVLIAAPGWSNGLSNFENVVETQFESVFARMMLGFAKLIRGGTTILGHIRDVRQEWVSFPGRKPADGCKFFTKNLRMGHNFDIILPGNGWFSSNLHKTYCSVVNFYCK